MTPIRNHNLESKDNRFTLTQTLLLLVVYFVGYTVVMPMLGSAMSYFVYKTPIGQIHPNFLMMIYLVILVMALLVAGKSLGKSWKDFVSGSKSIDHDSPWITVLKCWGMLFLFNIISGLLMQILLGADAQAGNQQLVVESLRQAPLINIFATVIFAPIVEELVFRGALYQSFRSEKSFWKAIAVSCLLFGAIHVLPQFANTHELTELLYLIPYSGMAFFMILAYEKTGSIFGAMGVHFLNNLVATVMILITM